MPSPDVQDYLDLFALYGGDLAKIYLEPADDRYRFLFEQICRLLVQPSAFNRQIPPPFVATARSYLAGDVGTLAKLGDPEVRHFMMSDLFDYIDLERRMSERRVSC